VRSEVGYDSPGSGERGRRKIIERTSAPQAVNKHGCNAYERGYVEHTSAAWKFWIKEQSTEMGHLRPANRLWVRPVESLEDMGIEFRISSDLVKSVESVE
jgi:hypothetical protein